MSKKNKHSIRKNRLRFLDGGVEHLERRILLASDLSDTLVRNAKEWEIELSKLPVTHFYRAGDEGVGLAIHPHRVAVRTSNSVSDSVEVNLGSPLRIVENGVGIYGGDNIGVFTSRQQLAASTGVEDVYPVFVSVESGTELVLIDEVIIALKDGVRADEFFQGNTVFKGYRPLMGTPDQFIATLAEGTDEVALQVTADVMEDARVAWASPNFYQNWQRFYIPNDPRFGNQWHLENTGQGGGLVGADSKLPGAWDFRQGAAPNIVLGIVDDGVARGAEAHPDLTLWVNPGEIPDNGIDDDGNGWIDDINGWNFVSNNNNSGQPASNDAHGTAVAGVAGANGDNGIGVAGAAYGSKILSSKIFEGNSVASDAGIASALYYAAGRTANGLSTWSASQIANNSWGGGAVSSAINAALAWATTDGNMGTGINNLVASGNGFSPSVSYPANRSATIPGVIAVGATNNKGERSNYSNWGPELDFVTPSNDTRSGYLAIDTTDRLGAAGYASGDYTGTGSTGFGGTSSATPLATGIAALVMARAQDLSVTMTPPQLRDYLRQNTDLAGGYTYNINTGKNIEFGYGRLNATSAVGNVGKPEISVVDTLIEYVDNANTIDFGTVFLGQTAEKQLRIRNQGSQPLTIHSISSTLGQYFVPGFTPTTLQLGEWMVIGVQSNYSMLGSISDTLSIFSNDADENEFTIQLDAEVVRPAVRGNLFEDFNGNGVFDSHEGNLSNRRVYVDLDENGSLNISNSEYLQSTPMSIPDLSTINSTQVISGAVGEITDLNVRVNITHTWNGDLRAWLIGPDGTMVNLFSNVGGSSDNFTNTVFDDEAGTAINSGTGPFTGSFRPAQPLSAFDGKGLNGTWTLRIQDTAGGDVGTLQNWALLITHISEPFAFSNVFGDYAIPTVPMGTYPVRIADLAAQLTVTYPASQYQNVTLNHPTDFAENVDFGAGVNDRVYARVIDDTNYDGAANPGEAGLANQLVFVDAISNSVVDTDIPANFLNSTSTPVGAAGPVTSTINVTGTVGVVKDLNVRLNINHTYNADLSIYLVGPDGTRVHLFGGVGGSSDNFLNTVLDDEAATGIESGTAPFTGSFQPFEPLSNFDGKIPLGTWTLEVYDTYPSADSGTLNNWELIFLTEEASVLTNSNGIAIFDATPSSFDLKLVQPTGLYFTLPETGAHSISHSGVPVFERVFGVSTDLTVYGTGGHDHFDVNFTDGGSNVVVYRNGVLFQSGSLNPGASIVVMGSSGTDSLNLYGSDADDLFELFNDRTRVNGTDVLFFDIEYFSITGGAGSDTISGGGIASSQTWGLTGSGVGFVQFNPTIWFMQVENLVGGPRNDLFEILPSGSVAGSIDGGTGANSISYADTLNDGASAWTSDVNVNLSSGTATAVGGSIQNFQHVYGGEGNDQLTGNSLANILEGRGGDDTLVGNAGGDTLVGGDGNDSLNGGAGSDFLVGGQGDDFYVFGDALVLESDLLFEEPGEGNDTVSFVSSTTAVTFHLGLTTPQSAQTMRTITLSAGNVFENVFGGSGNDNLTGNSLNNRLEGRNGNDILNGLEGDDILVGGLGDDSYVFLPASTPELDTINEAAGAGRDFLDFGALTTSVIIDLGSTSNQNVHTNRTIKLSSGSVIEDARGGTSHDMLIGNALNNRLTGGQGNDTLVGNAGDDELIGNNGADILNGGSGNDILNGGGSNDTYVFGNASSAELDIIQEAFSAAVDTLDFTAVTVPITLNLSLTTVQSIHANRSIQLTDAAGIENFLGGSGNDTVIGNSQPNRLEGRAGNDSLNGAGGNDVLIGGLGDDVYLFGNASSAEADTITEQPGEGTDLISLSSLSISIDLNLGITTAQNVHTNRTLTLSHGNAVENAIGGSGNDTLIGNGLANRLTGGAGNDVLNGAGGDDVLVGGLGDDTFVFSNASSAEADQIIEQPSEGVDTVFFGDVSSAVTMTLSTTAVQAVHTNRTLKLNNAASIENLVGGSGNDVLTGNSLPNHLVGGPGNDTLNGAAGNDVLEGGLGDDWYVFGSASTAESDTVIEAVASGTDTLDFSAISSSVTLGLSLTTSQAVHTNRTLTLSHGSAFENAIGGTNNDTLTGNGRPNRLEGRAGNDFLNGQGGDDTLVGGLGNDTYTFTNAATIEEDVIEELTNEGTDTITFSTLSIPVSLNLSLTSIQNVHTNRTIRLTNGSAIERAIGGSGDDTLVGNALNNHLTGGAGNDSLNGGGGDDTLVGGLGDDTYVFVPASSLEVDTITELVGEGTDTITFGTLSANVTLNLGTTAIQNVHTNRTLKLNHASVIENATGGSGNDVLIGNSLANRLVGNAGSDSLNGKGGNDELLGGLGDDVYVFDVASSSESDTILESAGNGTDTLDFSAITSSVILDLSLTTPQAVHTNRTLTLGNGGAFENAIGGTGNDTLSGNALANQLVGGNGNDILNGRAGDDQLVGGLGNDTYVFGVATTSETDTISELPDQGTDTIDFAAIVSDVIFNLSSTSVQLVHTQRNVRLTSGSAIENLVGGSGNDQLTGNALNNRLTGGDGNDRLRGNAGDDVLIGGLGDDTYVFTAASSAEADSITELSGQGTDTIDFSGMSTPVTLNLGTTDIQAVHTNRTLRLNNAVAIENAQGGANHDTLIGNNLANTLVGNGGNDVLRGERGNDVLIGGIGNDRYQFGDAVSTEADSIIENENEGIDTIDMAEVTSDIVLSLNLTSVQTVHFRRTLILSHGGAIENAIGGTGNDQLTGNALNNELNGSDGNDTLNGGAGNDVLVGGTGDDFYVFGNATASEADVVSELPDQGTDTITFASVTANVALNLGSTAIQPVHFNRTLRLGSSSAIENLIGGSGNDTLIGNGLANRLTGNAGNDLLIGDGGDDTLVGGLGDDTYRFNNASSAELDIVIEAAGQGTDTLDFASVTVAITLNLALATDQSIHSNRTLRLSSGSGIENVQGGSSHDILLGNGLNNVLIGNFGNDILVGLGGNDTLNGGNGRDILIGGVGVDQLLGGNDDDILIAGRTLIDTVVEDLVKIRNEWISGRSYAARVANIRAGVGAPPVALQAQTNVLTDGPNVDELFGGLGQDWFFLALNDVLMDLEAGELQDQL